MKSQPINAYKNILKNIEKQLHVSKKQQWYKVNLSTKILKYGNQIASTDTIPKNSRYLEGSLNNLLKTVYPNQYWKEWLLPGRCKWQKLTQRTYLLYFSNNHNLYVITDWYNIRSNTLLDEKGGEFIRIYQNSLQKTLTEIFPEHMDFWYAWKFSQVPNRYWESLQHQRLYMKELEQKFDIKNMEDWYKIPTANFGPIYLQYSSIFQLLATIFPKFEWDRSNFDKKPRNYWNNLMNHRICLNEGEKNLGIKKIENWNKISLSKVKTQLNTLYDQYFSMLKMLQTLYPEITWLPWNFMQVPNNYWNNSKNQLLYLQDSEKRLNIKTKQDWYKISPKKIFPVYRLYPSMSKMLKILYPNYLWKPWKFKNSENGLWDSIHTQRLFIEEISFKLNLKNFLQWYTLPYENFKKHGSLYKKYTSTVNLLQTIYPEFFWKPWKFPHVPKGHWDYLPNQKLFLDQVEKDLNLKKKEDWYSVLADFFRRKYSDNLYARYNSMYLMLKNIYSYDNWFPWKFDFISWKEMNKKNIRMYIEDIVIESTNNMEELYDKKFEEITQFRGRSLLSKRYKSNLLLCFADIFPEKNWLPWIFKTPVEFWQKKEHVLQFLNYVENQIGMESKKDWYFVTYDQVRRLGGASLLFKDKSLPKILLKYFPNENWDKKKLKTIFSGRKNQFNLFKFIQTLFPTEIVMLNYKHPDLLFKSSNIQIEYDIFIPALNLGFEYQGKQHYERTSLYGDSFNIQSRDNEKRELSKENSITLVEISYTWDGTLSNLKDIINSSRPDIFEKMKTKKISN